MPQQAYVFFLIHLDILCSPRAFIFHMRGNHCIDDTGATSRRAEPIAETENNGSCEKENLPYLGLGLSECGPSGWFDYLCKIMGWRHLYLNIRNLRSKEEMIN